jgi:secondary thiamine-phosphate synthase enzyme
MKIVPIKTSSRSEFIDITSKIQEVVHKNKWSDGILCVYVPHTTAGITINEHADPSVVRDILDTLNKIAPSSANYRHTEGNADSHIKASLTGSSTLLIVEDGKLVLGRWQGIFFCEFDGPRNREIFLYFNR